MEHEYAEILRAFADDKDVRLESKSITQDWWFSTNTREAIRSIINLEGMRFRIAPKTIRIGDMDVREPMRVAPAVGTEYWFVVTVYIDFTDFHTWVDDEEDNRLLKLGICHLTEADCHTHAEALIKVSGGVL